LEELPAAQDSGRIGQHCIVPVMPGG
jgi:hypothetical protein